MIVILVIPAFAGIGRVLLRGLFRPHRLDLGGAELELGDLADGVELRVGQQIGGGLGEAEGNEDHALGHVPVLAHLEDDGAAAGRHFHEAAGGDAEGFGLRNVAEGLPATSETLFAIGS